MTQQDQRILDAALAEQSELALEICVKAMDELCSRSQHDPEPEDVDGVQVLVCSWCRCPI